MQLSWMTSVGPVSSRVLMRKRQEYQSQRGDVTTEAQFTERPENATLPALTMEGAQSQGLQAGPRKWKRLS